MHHESDPLDLLFQIHNKKKGLRNNLGIVCTVLFLNHKPTVNL